MIINNYLVFELEGCAQMVETPFYVYKCFNTICFNRFLAIFQSSLQWHTDMNFLAEKNELYLSSNLNKQTIKWLFSLVTPLPLHKVLTMIFSLHIAVVYKMLLLFTVFHNARLKEKFFQAIVIKSFLKLSLSLASSFCLSFPLSCNFKTFSFTFSFH
jgi:uncharacterized protein YqhQ